MVKGHVDKTSLFSMFAATFAGFRARASFPVAPQLGLYIQDMTSFSDLGLSPEVIKAVTDSGYDTPTPIQAQAIPVALEGRDVLGIAQTGTGKTAAFTLPMIDRLAAGRSKARMPRSLVIAPTRELADQVAASFEKYAKGRKLSWALLIGGVFWRPGTKAGSGRRRSDRHAGTPVGPLRARQVAAHRRADPGGR
jgi:hypothetical protein